MSKCSRREFVINLMVAGGALAVAPQLVMADSESAAGGQVYWAKMGAVSAFDGKPGKLVPYPSGFGKKKAYLKVSDGKTVTALSLICPHQGCPVDFDAATKQFVCPCHGAKFTDSGAVITGPATTPLVALQTKIEDGQVFVQSLTPPKAAS